MIPKNSSKPYFSSSEIAQILGISRIAVHKKIKLGYIKAEKIGRNYAVSKEDLENFLGSSISENQKKDIENIVKRAVKEYGVTFKRLGREE